LVAELRAFVDGPYASDIQALRGAFPTYDDLGASNAAFLAFGAFPDEQGLRLLPAGVCDVTGGITPIVDTGAITESTKSALYLAAPPAPPTTSATEPALDRTDAYSWIKAPRLAGQACEVGPLARAILSGRDLGHRGVMARHHARHSEASLLATAIGTWLAELSPDVSGLPVFPQVPMSGSGSGLTEGPRGALGHWLDIAAGAVSHYGIIAPTTWNASPGDDQAVPGPIERALQGVSLADPADPIEILRIVHSFDPCLQCAVH
jgi:hydrogenase large subunit